MVKPAESRLRATAERICGGTVVVVMRHPFRLLVLVIILVVGVTYAAEAALRQYGTHEYGAPPAVAVVRPLPPGDVIVADEVAPINGAGASEARILVVRPPAGITGGAAAATFGSALNGRGWEVTAGGIGTSPRGTACVDLIAGHGAVAAATRAIGGVAPNEATVISRVDGHDPRGDFLIEETPCQ